MKFWNFIREEEQRFTLDNVLLEIKIEAFRLDNNFTLIKEFRPLIAAHVESLIKSKMVRNKKEVELFILSPLNYFLHFINQGYLFPDTGTYPAVLLNVGIVHLVKSVETKLVFKKTNEMPCPRCKEIRHKKDAEVCDYCDKILATL